jgi:hypothetical protein
VNPEEIISSHLAEIGHKGGKVKTAKKLKAAKRNLIAARKARWAGKPRRPKGLKRGRP